MKSSFFASLLAAGVVAGGLVGEIAAQVAAEPWWLQPHRLLQTNLREIDATMDLDRYVADVQAFGADVVLFNVGGIVANYPTHLENHFQNTHMDGDLVGEALQRLHAAGIRMIGRFDFSKINEQFAANHPEWLYVGEDGRNVNYNGQVHTCVSGGYQQEYMFKVLEEAVDRFPLDGVFFNMIGFQRRDYSGEYHGICQCDNCRRLFQKETGLDLPATQLEDDATYQRYVDFTKSMSDRQFRRVNAFLKAKRPDLAICTYTSSGVDVIRKESNSALGQGAYHDSDKAKWTLRTGGDRQLANAAVHFIRIPFRHSAVSPYLTTRRLWQQMVNGAWLDFYCIGPLARQEDRTGLDLAAKIYRFHAANEPWLIDTEPAGEVGVVRRGDDEFRGIQQILSENQIAYELIRATASDLAPFRLVIVPRAAALNRNEVGPLNAYVREGGKLLLTGGVPDGLECLQDARLVEQRPAEKGSYVRIRADDKTRLGSEALAPLDLVYLNGPFAAYEIGADMEGLLRLIPGDMFGPPEKCYYRSVSGFPGLISAQHGEGATACFTFGVGAHYLQQAHQGHAALLVGAIDNLLPNGRRLQATASPLVEINHRTAAGFEWVSLYNHSGQRGIALHKPVPIHDVELSLAPSKPVRSVRLLQAGDEIPFTTDEEGRVRVALPPLEDYEIAVFQYDAGG